MKKRSELYYIWRRFRNEYLSYRKWRNWLFYPSNVLKIRNVPRTWCDRDQRLFHANFTILCDFIEKEHHGKKKFDDYVAWCTKEWEDCGGENQDYDKTGKMFPKHQYEDAITYKKLYDWYTSIDWENVWDFDDFKEECAFNELCHNNLKLLIDCYGGMWT